MKEEALKLADELDEWVSLRTVEQASAMIRKLVAELDKQEDRIGELEKQGEPVEHDFMAWETCGILSAEPHAYNATPVKLYRHPPQTKPLSDEEIEKLKQKHIEIEWFDEGEYGFEYNIYGVEEFARAIEAKVRGEK